MAIYHKLIQTEHKGVRPDWINSDVYRRINFGVINNETHYPQQTPNTDKFYDFKINSNDRIERGLLHNSQILLNPDMLGLDHAFNQYVISSNACLEYALAD